MRIAIDIAKEYYDKILTHEINDSHLVPLYKALTNGIQETEILDKIRTEVLEYIDDSDIAVEICDIFNKYEGEIEESCEIQRMDSTELKFILNNHKHWINKDCEGWEKMRANLCKADLSGANLSIVDLRGANLQDANLSRANLRGARLRGADLSRANLVGADLYGGNLFVANLIQADLTGANLQDANLRGADLYGAGLTGTNLYRANLYRADLRKANLYDTILHRADLREADLSGTNLHGADLRGAKGPLIEYRTGKILDQSIIGYKKCKNNVIVTLEIPRGAIVFSIDGRKCRTNKAKVINIDGADKAVSMFRGISYYIGDEFTIYNFDCEYNVECREGIHFFMSREEAESYD